MSKKPNVEKPKSISIIEVKRTRRFISIHYKKGDEDFKIRSNENPLASFVKSLDALVPIVIAVCEVPANWDTNLRVSGFSVSDMRDAQTVCVRAIKSVTLSGAVLEIDTPAALLGTPKTEGAVTQPLDKAQIGLVEDAIEEAKRYVKGERAQGTLTLDADAEDDEEDNGTGTEPAQGELIKLPAKKKRGTKADAAAAK